MGKARVLIVDDSVVIRRLLAKVLEDEPCLEVAGIAQNGKIALNKIEQVRPDLVVLDVEMPEMDGLEALRELRKTHPRLPVIMFSTLTQRGATSTLDALSHGANDYLTKPEGAGSMADALQIVREQMVPKIRSLCGLAEPAPTPRPRRRTPATDAPRRRPVGGRAARAIVVGVSTGGPNALAEVIPHLPQRLAVPVLVVQHMPPMFTKLLAERLHSKSAIRVCEAEAGQLVEPGTVYIAPGDHHMVPVREGDSVRIRLNQEAPENSCRPAADVLFRQAAEIWGDRLLGVVMTGMGQDGFRGAETIVDAGGRIIAQDEATSVVWGMPGYVARGGLAEAVVPLEDLAGEMTRRSDAVANLLTSSEPAKAGKM